MPPCITLTTDILGICSYENVAGVEQSVVVINRSDVDYAACTFDSSNPTIITKLQLLSGKIGYVLEGVKATNIVTSTPVANPAGSDTFKNSFECIVTNNSTNSKAIDAINKSQKGFVVVYMAKTKDVADIEAFRVLGLTNGLFGMATYSSNENNGAYKLTLANLDGLDEPYPVRFLQMGTGGTRYATTLAAFNGKFVQP